MDDLQKAKAAQEKKIKDAQQKRFNDGLKRFHEFAPNTAAALFDLVKNRQLDAECGYEALMLCLKTINEIQLIA